MLIERDTVVEAAVTLGAVALFIGIILVGDTITHTQAFTTQEGYTVVGAIVAFVLVMAGAGLYLSTKQD
ncbi:DUF7472 family protein [Halarchaeum sp. P4]|uniref:DUF7472 family protein n=1 Tax=Halarchaeum sp. P4 TaxID=3421639 RepID=UPI003EBA0970